MANDMKDSKMILALKQYLEETPDEQIKSDWNSVKDLDLQGPTIKEFMKNNQFQEALSQVKPETTEKIQKYTDISIEDLQFEFALTDMIEEIIDEAYKLYMPQVRSEITDLTRLVIQNSGLKNDQPINVLEIGTKFGGTFHIWNSINPNGMNISIDMSDGGIHGGISEEEMDKRDLWFAERFHNCHFIRGDSHEDNTLENLRILLQKLIYQYPEKLHLGPLDKIDFLFIDGDHSYEGVKKDFEDYSPFVKSKSIIAFHDIIISDHHHSRNVFVGEFWNEIKNDDRFDLIEIVADINQTWAGIGILIKK